ncbi:A disintegrin and metalloproteinase with thrombospondin motifs gon-1, partial [Trichinella pseudospiralis]
LAFVGAMQAVRCCCCCYCCCCYCCYCSGRLLASALLLLPLFLLLFAVSADSQKLSPTSNSPSRIVVFPRLLSSQWSTRSRIKRGAGATPDSCLYALDNFGAPLLLNVTRQDNLVGNLLAPNFIVQHLSANYTWADELDQTLHNCLYNGDVLVDEEPIRGAVRLLNLCQGMYGTVELNDGTYFIEPLNTANNENGSSSSATTTPTASLLLHSRPHVLYKSVPAKFNDQYPEDNWSDSRQRKYNSTDKINNNNTHYVTNTAKKNATSQDENCSEKLSQHVNCPFSTCEKKNSSARYKRSYSREYFVELLVVADARMRLYHRHNLENYVLTLLSLVATVYRHPSLEASLSINLVRLLIVDFENAGPRVSDNAQETLREFCRWQQTMNDPDDDSLNHHDVAVLLTRHDICRMPGKCDTLGLAELGTMCDPYRSCAIIEDNGLSAAFTIAHELGHIFNVPHDDEKKCAQFMTLNKENYHIMAPTLEFNTHPWSWSPCSTALLNKFLESGQVHCMLDKPVQQKYTERLTTNPAPGLTFDADQQCRFVFGPTSNLCPYMPTCKRLWCTTVYGFGHSVGCRTQHMPWADGTPCGHERWCYRGDCVGIAPEHMTAVDGAWGEWKAWSECSRTCGGGIKRARRECDSPRPANGGKYCVGERVRFRSCNTKECPIDSPDFREVQCSEFNGKPVGIYGLSSDVKWVPKYNGTVVATDRCKLYCRVFNSAAFYLLKDKVVDGTPCGRYTDDICVDGICRKAGCDNRLGSQLKRDDCGVCGGDGTTCRKVSGVYNEVPQYGYNFVMKIPIGASNIDIRQVAWNGKMEDDNYLGKLGTLRNSKGDYLLNGQFQVSVYFKEIQVQGTVIEYSGSDSPVERINASRPIMEELFLHVLSVGNLHSPDIRYNYSIPNNAGSVQTVSNFLWRMTDEWTDCSSECHGSQNLKIVCSSVQNEEQIVDDRYCEHMKKPDRVMRVCNLHCQISWQQEPLSDCSAICGAGEQVMRVLCVRKMSDQTVYPVDNSLCRDLEKPSDRKPCYKDCAGRRWAHGDWQPCSVSCGGGTQRRQAFCVDSNNNVIDDRYCENVINDITEQPCNIAPCPKWSYGDWMQCSASCDGGIQSRHAVCLDAAGREVDSILCDQSERLVIQKCNEHTCTHWKFGPWSEVSEISYSTIIRLFKLYNCSKCSKTCGDGIAVRAAWCVDSKGVTLDESKCPKEEKIISKSCQHLTACPKWKLSEWSPCSRTCMDGWRTRRVHCVDGNDQLLDSKYCADSHQSHPPTHQPCNLGQCPFWRRQQWGPCSVTCGSGVQQRAVECVYKDEVVDTGYCRDIAQPDRYRPCELIPCPEWEVSPWEQCSVTCGTGYQQRSVQCIYQENRMPAETGACVESKRPKVIRTCTKVPCPDRGYDPKAISSWQHPANVLKSNQILRTTILTQVSDGQSPTKWETGSWTDCSAICGLGRRSRLVACRDMFGRFLPDQYCNHLQPPASEEACESTAHCGNWKTGPWQSCSELCGENLKAYRQVVCVSPQTNDHLEEADCDVRTKPSDERSCNLPPCGQSLPSEVDNEKYKWRVGDWSECSRSCGGGQQQRLVQCVQAITVSESVEHSATCSSSNRPNSIRLCNTQACTTTRGKWRPLQWSACSSTCGRGYRRRQVHCVDADTLQLLDDKHCDPLDKPLPVHRCRMRACPRWRTSKWSPCSVTCGEGVRTRKLNCVVGRRQLLPDTDCQSSVKPDTVAKCFLKECPKYRWLVSDWSKCTKFCGEENRVREVYCVNNYNQRAPPALCDESNKPPAVQLCLNDLCPYTWVPGPWSTCSKTCGQGEEFRLLFCVKKGSDAGGAEVPAHLCKALPEPITKRQCFHGPCDSKYFWHPEPWTACSVHCGWGIQERRLKCVDRNGLKTAKEYCSLELRPKKRRRCFVKNCEPRDCDEVRETRNATIDGHYHVWVYGNKVKVYCYGMASLHPKEYLTVNPETNFAEFYDKRLLYPFTCPYNGMRNDSCQCADEQTPNPGMTRFHKIQVDLHNMKVKLDDRLFSSTERGGFIPYATAGDCYSAVNCPQGRFSIDLRGTGFRVSPKTTWMHEGHRAFSEVKRNTNSVLVIGSCGGYCGKCAPHKRVGLLIETLVES